ncbi:MAG: hypothetical protein FJ104_01920 [Deltaproteobacteria bacterium]|nr:hypothetical protein [Deltaproteobacteria bacterium]
MKTKLRQLATLGVLVPVALAASCSSDPKTRGQLMLAISADLSIPQNMNEVLIDVIDEQGNKQNPIYPIRPEALGKPIPGTVAVIPAGAGGDKLRIRVIGQRNDGANVKVRVVREAVVTVPRGRVGLLTMPIRWLCDGRIQPSDDGSFESDCGPDETCQAGTCVSAVVDSESLPDYQPELVFGGGQEDGTGGECFDVRSCFERGVDAMPGEGCSLPMPTGGEGVSVAMVPSAAGEGHCAKDGAGDCYLPLDKDETEGWKEQDGRLVLPGQVCERVKKGSVTKLRVTTACATKTLATPLCGPWSNVERVAPVGQQTAPLPPDPGAGDTDGGATGGGDAGSRDGGVIDPGAGGAPNAADGGFGGSTGRPDAGIGGGAGRADAGTGQGGTAPSDAGSGEVCASDVDCPAGQTCDRSRGVCVAGAPACFGFPLTPAPSRLQIVVDVSQPAGPLNAIGTAVSQALAGAPPGFEVGVSVFGGTCGDPGRPLLPMQPAGGASFANLANLLGAEAAGTGQARFGQALSFAESLLGTAPNAAILLFTPGVNGACGAEGNGPALSAAAALGSGFKTWVAAVGSVATPQLLADVASAGGTVAPYIFPPNGTVADLGPLLSPLVSSLDVSCKFSSGAVLPPGGDLQVRGGVVGVLTVPVGPAGAACSDAPGAVLSADGRGVSLCPFTCNQVLGGPPPSLTYVDKACGGGGAADAGVGGGTGAGGGPGAGGASAMDAGVGGGAGAGGAPPCDPLPCALVGAQCGQAPDGCGGLQFCGGCISPAVCVAGRCEAGPPPPADAGVAMDAGAPGCSPVTCPGGCCLPTDVCDVDVGFGCGCPPVEPSPSQPCPGLESASCFYPQALVSAECIAGTWMVAMP